jgi:hypothetical protein
VLAFADAFLEAWQTKIRRPPCKRHLYRGHDGAQLDIPDPDGTVIRFLSPNDDDGPAFAGIELGVGGRMTFYDAPRLAV